MQETFELPTEVWAGNSVKRLFEYVSTQHPDAKLPGSDPKSYDTSTHTSDYVERYMKMALWEKMELRGAMLMIMSHFIREAKPRLWTSDERMKRVLKHIQDPVVRCQSRSPHEVSVVPALPLSEGRVAGK